jgi:Fe-S-cluster containining protein
MLAHEDLRCPFVTPAGCTVYEDRPGSCRTYPLGRIAARKRGEQACKESYILIREDHCLGLKEPKEWTVREWKKAQELDTYNQMNDLMMDILSLKNQSGKERLTKEESDVFCMACYDLDRFRGFAGEHRLWEPAPVGQGPSQAVEDDDVALMRFAIEWIKARLFGRT